MSHAAPNPRPSGSRRWLARPTAATVPVFARDLDAIVREMTGG